MHPRFASILGSWRGWLRDEPPRWDEAKDAAYALLKGDRDAARKGRDSALDRLDACQRHAKEQADKLLVLSRENELLIAERDSTRAELGRARASTKTAADSLDKRLREALATINRLEAEMAKLKEEADQAVAASKLAVEIADRSTAALMAVAQTVDDFRGMTNRPDGA